MRLSLLLLLSTLASGQTPADPAYQPLSKAYQLLQTKQYDEAIRGLTRTLDLDPSLTHVYFLRAAARERAGDLRGAKKDREQGLSRKPAQPVV